MQTTTTKSVTWSFWGGLHLDSCRLRTTRICEVPKRHLLTVEVFDIEHWFHETPTAWLLHYNNLCFFIHPPLPRFALPRSRCCKHSIISHTGWPGGKPWWNRCWHSNYYCYIARAPDRSIHPPAPRPRTRFRPGKWEGWGDSHPHPSDQNPKCGVPPGNRPDSGIFK